MESVKVIGRIELPAPAKELFQCLCCGLYKPAKDFPYGQAVSLYDCIDCEFSNFIDTPPLNGIQRNFFNDVITDIEDDIELL